MKVLMISPEFSIRETKGLARYAFEIYKRLKEIFVIDLVFRKRFHKGFFGFIYSLLYTNFIVLLKGRKYDVIHAISPELSIFASIFYRKKLIVTFHDLFPITHWKKLKYKVGLLTYLLSYIIWKIASKAKIVVVNSSLTKKYIEEKFKRFDAKVILEGVSENIRQIKNKSDILTICFVGNYSYRKRVDIAIKIFKRLKEVEKTKLIIVGGKLKSIYQVNFDLNNIKDRDIEFLDKIGDEKLIEVYSTSHFLIFPSIIEGFGLPILEAIKCNTLPITFKYSEIPKEIKELSIECKDVEDATKKIIYYWKNKNKFKKLINLFNKKIKKFSWNKSYKEYMKLYKSIAIYGKN